MGHCNELVDNLDITFNLNDGPLQAILETRQQDDLHKCTIKPFTKHNQTTTKNNRTAAVQQLF